MVQRTHFPCLLPLPWSCPSPHPIPHFIFLLFFTTDLQNARLTWVLLPSYNVCVAGQGLYLHTTKLNVLQFNSSSVTTYPEDCIRFYRLRAHQMPRPHHPFRGEVTHRLHLGFSLTGYRLDGQKTLSLGLFNLIGQTSEAICKSMLLPVLPSDGL